MEGIPHAGYPKLCTHQGVSYAKLHRVLRPARATVRPWPHRRTDHRPTHSPSPRSPPGLCVYQDDTWAATKSTVCWSSAWQQGQQQAPGPDEARGRRHPSRRRKRTLRAQEEQCSGTSYETAHTARASAEFGAWSVCADMSTTTVGISPEVACFDRNFRHGRQPSSSALIRPMDSCIAHRSGGGSRGRGAQPAGWNDLSSFGRPPNPLV